MPVTTTPLRFPSFSDLQNLIDLARREDWRDDDVTSRLLIDPSAVGNGVLVQKQPGVICALPLVEMICRVYDPALRVQPLAGFPLDLLEARYSDGAHVPLLRIVGPMRSMLSAERVILNFLQRASGVATLTRRYVQRVSGTRARIYDTRKTIPGFRALDKYAVRAGGGFNHRMGLYDGLLMKDNHLVGHSGKDLTAFVASVVQRSRAEAPGRFIEVEVDTLDQLRAVLPVEGIDVILLDNMDCPTMSKAVQLRNEAGRAGKTDLEASGGITLDTTRAAAQTGVERIAIGALTHSATALDISLEVGH